MKFNSIFREDIIEARKWFQKSIQKKYDCRNNKIDFVFPENLTAELENVLGDFRKKKYLLEYHPVDNCLQCGFAKEKFAASYHFYFQYIDWFKPDTKKVIFLPNLLQDTQKLISKCKIDIIIKLAQFLYENSIYQDDKNIIFFNQIPIKLSFNTESDSVDTFISYIKELTNESCIRIRKFIEFMHKDIGNSNSEKWAIFAGQLKKYADENNEISYLDFLKKLKKIKEETMISFEAYLEDFSYSKFEKKIEEETEKISGRLFDALKNIQTQIIGIPILALISRLTISNGRSVLIYWVLLGFSIMILFNLEVSRYYLKFLKEELEDFNKKLSSDIEKKFSTKSKAIRKIIYRQNYLIILYYLFAIVGLLYALWNLPFFCQIIALILKCFSNLISLL